MSEHLSCLSVCVIAKNEAANLPRCLASVEGLADELLVTDTGSTDDTVELAVQAGASVDHFGWIDDFSAAYNHCVGRATSEWVLLLDADEELLLESRDEVRRAIQLDDAFAFTVLRQDLHDANRPDDYTEMLQARLFRRRNGMLFTGRIHHQFTPPLSEFAAAEGRKLCTSAIRLRHYGYVGGDKRPKLKRAQRLMALELEDRPNQFYYLVELGRTRIALGDQSGVEPLHRAAEQVAAGEEEVEDNPGQLALLLEHLLACDVLPNGFPLSIAKADEIASRHFPNSVPLLWQRALARFKSNCFGECAELLELILELGRSGEYDKLVSFKPDIMGRDLLLNLGVCYTRLGRVKEALRCFEQLTNDDKHGKSARMNVQAIRRILGKRLA